MQRTLIVALAWGLAACGSSPPPAPDAPRRSAKEAKAEARGLIDEAYRVMRTGTPTDMMGLLAPDLFFVGPGPADVGLDRAAVLELAGGLVDDRKKHKLKSFGLELFGGPDGRTAYAFDQVEYDGVAFAVTAIAAEVDGIWRLTTIELARAISSRKLDTAVAPGPLPAWRPADDRDAAHAAAPREMVEAIGLAADDVDDRLRQYGSSDDAAFVGPSPDEVSLGGKAIGKRWKKRAPRWTVGEVVAGASPDGALVWVVANATKVEQPDDRDDDRDRGRKRKRKPEPAPEPVEAAPATGGPPRRLFAIYRDDGGKAGWDLAVLHEAVVVAR